MKKTFICNFTKTHNIIVGLRAIQGTHSQTHAHTYRTTDLKCTCIRDIHSACLHTLYLNARLRSVCVCVWGGGLCRF